MTTDLDEACAGATRLVSIQAAMLAAGIRRRKPGCLAELLHVSWT